jgi:hypothetical protein
MIDIIAALLLCGLALWLSHSYGGRWSRAWVGLGARFYSWMHPECPKCFGRGFFIHARILHFEETALRIENTLADLAGKPRSSLSEPSQQVCDRCEGTGKVLRWKR